MTDYEMEKLSGLIARKVVEVMLEVDARRGNTPIKVGEEFRPGPVVSDLTMREEMPRKRGRPRKFPWAR